MENDFNNVVFEPGFNNFDVEEINTSETINAVFIIDVSPSISSYENELNAAFNELIAEMQGSHIADDLFVSQITFADDIRTKQGFQPVISIQKSNFQGQGFGPGLFPFRT